MFRNLSFFLINFVRVLVNNSHVFDFLFPTIFLRYVLITVTIVIRIIVLTIIFSFLVILFYLLLHTYSVDFLMQRGLLKIQRIIHRMVVLIFNWVIHRTFLLIFIYRVTHTRLILINLNSSYIFPFNFLIFHLLFNRLLNTILLLLTQLILYFTFLTFLQMYFHQWMSQHILKRYSLLNFNKQTLLNKILALHWNPNLINIKTNLITYNFFFQFLFSARIPRHCSKQ